MYMGGYRSVGLRGEENRWEDVSISLTEYSDYAKIVYKIFPHKKCNSTVLLVVFANLHSVMHIVLAIYIHRACMQLLFYNLFYIQVTSIYYK